MTRRLAVLGSTGSIGQQTLDVVREFPDAFDVVALSAHSSREELLRQREEFDPEVVALSDPEVDPPAGALHGPESLQELARRDLDLLVLAVVGAAGLRPCLTALEQNTDVALANKEVLVAGGDLVNQARDRSEARLLPVDSEHSALFQLLRGEDPDRIRRVVITASGGAFRDYPLDQLEEVTPDDALDHPNWEMGAKITVDSATMMNKGLEVIEAVHLFELDPDRVQALIHPQSAIHGFVEFKDHSIKAQASVPDMKLAIQYALFHPDRRAPVIESMNLGEPFQWEFEPIDTERFPAYQLARDAMGEGGTAPVVVNAANEEAVRAFLEERISFTEIPTLVRRCMEDCPMTLGDSLESVLRADRWARDHFRTEYLAVS